MPNGQRAIRCEFPLRNLQEIPLYFFKIKKKYQRSQLQPTTRKSNVLICKLMAQYNELLVFFTFSISLPEKSIFCNKKKRNEKCSIRYASEHEKNRKKRSLIRLSAQNIVSFIAVHSQFRRVECSIHFHFHEQIACIIIYNIINII